MSETTLKSTADAALLSAGHPDIVNALAASYDRVAAEEDQPRRNLHRLRVCGWVSNALRAELFGLGYQPFTLGRHLHPGGEHQYLGLESERGLVLVDGTWQQFLPVIRRPFSPKPVLPKVLVGTRQEVVDFAGNAGVPETKLNFWKPTIPPGVAVVKDHDGRVFVQE